MVALLLAYGMPALLDHYSADLTVPGASGVPTYIHCDAYVAGRLARIEIGNQTVLFLDDESYSLLAVDTKRSESLFLTLGTGTAESLRTLGEIESFLLPVIPNHSGPDFGMRSFAERAIAAGAKWQPNSQTQMATVSYSFMNGRVSWSFFDGEESVMRTWSFVSPDGLIRSMSMSYEGQERISPAFSVVPSASRYTEAEIQGKGLVPRSGFLKGESQVMRWITSHSAYTRGS